MRIGLITGEYPPMQGGVGAFTRELAVAMRELGHEVDVLTRQEAGASIDPGINVIGAIGKRWNWGTVDEIAQWAENSKLEILNIQFQTAAFDMHPAIHWTARQLRAAGIPVITTFHDLRVPYLFPKAGPIRKLAVRLLASWSSAAIATDREDEATLVRGWGIKHARWIPIGSNINPVAAEAANRDSVRREFGVSNSGLLISYFGFLNETKGALVLMEAVDQLVQSGIDAHVIMIGGRAGASDPTNWDYGMRVDEAIARMGLSERIHWSGFVDDAAVSKYFYASDITALPYLDGASLRRGTLMAALAHGRAIVTTHPAAEEIADAVVTVPADDADVLSQGIARLWQDKAQRTMLEQRSAKAAQQFTWGTIAQHTIDYYREILGQ